MSVELKNAGCTTSAPNAEFFVSSVGDIFRSNEVLECSSLDCAALAKEKGFDWKVVCLFTRKSKTALAKRWFAAIDAAWDEQYKNCLSRKEYNFLTKILGFWNALKDDGRFRVYGEIANGTPRIVVVTEFREACDDAMDDFWLRLKNTAKHLKARVWIMEEDIESDYSYRTDKQGVKIPGSEKYGPLHNRPVRQVELSWRIEKLDVGAFKNFVSALRQKTQPLWKRAGVCVG